MIKLIGALALLLPSAAWSQDADLRFCPNRPSLGESGCTTDSGHVQFEISAVDWTLDKDRVNREDTVLVGDFQARFGLTNTSELQVAWTPYGHVRTRDRVAGEVRQQARVGDLQLGIRQNLRNPDGSGLSFAIEPSVTLPVGRGPVGAGSWGAGIVLPVTYDLTDSVNLALTNEIRATPDEDGHGRHFAVNEVLGLGYDLSARVTAVAELQIVRDNDPLGHQTQAFAAGSLAWMPRRNLQFDVLVGAGLNHNAPDMQVLTGGAVLF